MLIFRYIVGKFKYIKVLLALNIAVGIFILAFSPYTCADENRDFLFAKQAFEDEFFDIARETETPTMKRKKGKIMSVAVQPCHSA